MAALEAEQQQISCNNERLVAEVAALQQALEAAQSAVASAMQTESGAGTSPAQVPLIPPLASSVQGVSVDGPVPALACWQGGRPFL